jgi:hypothetical protein
LHLGRWVHPVADHERLRRRPARAGRVGPRAEQLVEQRAARFTLGCAADAEEPAALAHVVGERALLLGVQPIAVGVEEHHRAVAGQVGRVEVGRVGGVRGLVGAGAAEVAERRHPRGDLRSAGRGGMEHQDPLRLGAGGRGKDQHERDRAQQTP